MPLAKDMRYAMFFGPKLILFFVASGCFRLTARSRFLYSVLRRSNSTGPEDPAYIPELLLSKHCRIQRALSAGSWTIRHRAA